MLMLRFDGYFHELVFVLISSCSSQLVHFVNRDSLGLANDFLSLGFIPEGVDIQSVADALQTSFGKGTQQSQDFQVFGCSLLTLLFRSISWQVGIIST